MTTKTTKPIGPTLADLLANLSTKKRAFILGGLSLMKDEEISKISKIELSVIKEIRALLKKDANFEAYLFNHFNAASLRKYVGYTPKKGVKKGLRYGNKAGFRDDLKIFVRSKTEANFARYLTWKYGRSAWDYESTEFVFPWKKGKTKKYIPDFRVLEKDGSYTYYEIKPGFLPNTNDPEKLDAFKLAHPTVKLIVVTYKASADVVAYCKKAGFEVAIYDDIKAIARKQNIYFE